MRYIELTQGKVAIVDDEDFEYLSQWKWHCSHNYAIRKQYTKVNGKKVGRHVAMHRVVNNTPEDLDTDHINGNGLDNRKENLRTATTSQNLMNKKIGKRGAWLHKGRIGNKCWQAKIKVNRKSISLGYYHTQQEAYDAYDKAAIKYHGEFACLNKEAA